MKRKLTLLFIWIFFQTAFSQVSKQVTFKQLTVEDGLSQNSVMSIAQDSVGFIWFNTEDGLNKYDGREFTHYNIPTSDAKREVKYISGEVFVDRAGILWVVASSGKLNRYQQKTDSFQEVSKFEQVITIAQDKKHNYYIGTYGEGLFKIDHQTKDTIQILKPEDRHFAVCSFVETDNKTILATTDDGIIEIKDNDYTFVELAPETIFSRFAKSEAGTIFLGSYEKGLYLKTPNDKGFESFAGFDGFPIPWDLIVKDLLVDKQDRLWITTERHGMYLVDFNLKTIQNFTDSKKDPNALGSNSLYFLHEDSAGTIWIGTQGAGVCYYDAYLTKFNVLTDDQVPHNVNIDVIRAITTDDKNAIWVGTEGKGLTKINPYDQEFFTYTTANSDLLGDRIASLFYDSGNLWIGHLNNGLQMMDANGKITSFEETAPFTVLKIFKDATDNMWLCTNRGLLQFDKHKGIVKQFTSEYSNLASNYYISTIEQDINTIAQGDTNTLWVGTEFDGLYKLDTKENKFSKIDGIPDRIFSLHYDDTVLWVGTNGNGLKAFDIKKGTVTTYTKKDGLPNDIIYGILSDSDGNLWLSSNRGITKLNIENGTISAIANYSNYFGLQSYEFNAGAYHKDANGILYFGGIKGLNWFDPKQLETNPSRPKTVITKMEVFNEERPLEDGLKLQHDQNTVSFTFASLQFSQPELSQYKYRLVNNDGNWIDAGNNNEAHYTNLPPNDYKFEVLSSNYDGVWGIEPTSYSFTILKPWYATNLARTMYALLILLLGYLLYYYLKWRWNLKNQLRLEHEETHRLKKLDELKTNLYANISHEFRTPLTLIAGPVENQLKKPNLTESDKKELGLVKQYTDRLVELINQMMDISILDSGQRRLNLTQGNLKALLMQLVEAFQYKAQDRKISIRSTIQGLDDCWFDRDMMEKTVSNLLSNAIKYAPENSDASIRANKHNGDLVLIVENETEHLNSKNPSRFFERFYQGNETSEGVGIGLALVKELVELAQGTITANTMEDSKIQFTLHIPVEQSTSMEGSVPNIGQTMQTNTDNFQTDTVAKVPRAVKESKNLPQLLIVDDTADVRMFIASNFEDEYQILEADNGKTGVDLAQKHLPSLIISDVMMPIKNGFELCDEIKQNALTSHIPVILLTAKVGEENEIQGFKTGADAYITKPFNTEKLKIRTEKLIDAQKRLAEHYKSTFSINPDLAITNTEAEFLKRLKSILDEHITDTEFNNESFCGLMHMSERQLHRKLKAIIGMTPSEFIRNERLKLAAELLKKSDATVSEIAYQVGFNTPSYFIKCFKEIHGYTPSEFSSNL
ncbi:two-component regulator propeller domain-containing protein [Muricauda sp. SK9]|uniref:hybrid sensor histidine kinase/response regulator transcription factor n=1 Tax=Flavobacteriaceae TaxID=49546 RepID=UPI0023494A1C|nr:hybrid sensor histidine kinase/response regulator transcription factor [Muricauda sp. SK9]MDC6384645.1 two-component regulator propeller domain-containing protein [Muricauda sp. SK9]